MIISGGFNYVINGAQYDGLARMNSNGTVDGNFSPPTFVRGSPNIVTLQPDGKILVAGRFRMFGGQVRDGFARLNSNGTLDAAFVSPITAPAGNSNNIASISLQPDGKILVGGNFAINWAPSTTSTHLIRLNTNGALDTTLNPNINNFSNTPVDAIAVQSNGKILIGGSF